MSHYTPFISISLLTSAQNSAKRRLLPRYDVRGFEQALVLYSSWDESDWRTMRRGRCLRVHIKRPYKWLGVKTLATTYVDLNCQLISRQYHHLWVRIQLAEPRILGPTARQHSRRLHDTQIHEYGRHYNITRGVSSRFNWYSHHPYVDLPSLPLTNILPIRHIRSTGRTPTRWRL